MNSIFPNYKQNVCKRNLCFYWQQDYFLLLQPKRKTTTTIIRRIPDLTMMEIIMATRIIAVIATTLEMIAGECILTGEMTGTIFIGTAMIFIGIVVTGTETVEIFTDMTTVGNYNGY